MVGRDLCPCQGANGAGLHQFCGRHLHQPTDSGGLQLRSGGPGGCLLAMYALQLRGPVHLATDVHLRHGRERHQWTHAAGFTITNTYNAALQLANVTSSLNDATHPPALATLAYAPSGALHTLLNGCAGTGAPSGRKRTTTTSDYSRCASSLVRPRTIRPITAWCTITTRARTRPAALCRPQDPITMAMRWATGIRIRRTQP